MRGHSRRSRADGAGGRTMKSFRSIAAVGVRWQADSQGGPRRGHSMVDQARHGGSKRSNEGDVVTSDATAARMEAARTGAATAARPNNRTPPQKKRGQRQNVALTQAG